MDNLDETASVISASKVTGTNVYNTDGDHLGEIHDIMLEKRSGNIAYAVMSFGGFLGIGERYHALPWSSLKYDTRQGGYVVGLTIDQLKEALPTPPMNCPPRSAHIRTEWHQDSIRVRPLDPHSEPLSCFPS